VPDTDARDAADIAARAGGLLVDLRADAAERDLDASTLRAEGDRRSNELICSLLAERHPGDAVLSEESADDRARVDAERVWIVDPLDGTREFAEAGRTDWAVHVALVRDGDPVAAAVGLPARGLVLSSAAPPPLPPAGSHVRLVVSRTRPPALTEPLAAALDAELVPMGSAGAKAMSVLLGDADVYAHAGGQYEWDSAAPVGVALAAGLHASRLDGSPLRYNRPDPYLPDLLICRPELTARVLEVLRELT